MLLLWACSDARWSQVVQDVSHTSLVPFLQKCVIADVFSAYLHAVLFS